MTQKEETNRTFDIGDVEKIRYESLIKWSEEDDKILDKIVDSLGRAENVDCTDYNIMYNWLKSLKQRMEE